MNLPVPADADTTASPLALLAVALDAPGLQLCSHAAASRWRGPLGQADVLPLPAGQPHRHHRLQVLRRVLDLQPDGRWGMDLTTGLARHPASQRHPALLRRLFLWLDGRRADAQLARCFPGALADLALDPAPPLPACLAARLPGVPPATPATPADALAARVACRAGPGDSDGRFYQARPIRQRSLSVALLLDTSSSTGFPIPSRNTSTTPEPLMDDVLWQASDSRRQMDSTPRRRVIDLARDAVALLCEALHALGDRHAVFGFSGAGRLNVDFAVVKDFGEPWSAAQAAALAAVQPQGATRTGAAVRHAARRLQAEPSRRKVLIVLSDGYPQDSDYGTGDDALQHGLQDTAQALREAQRAGIGCFNLSVDAAANDYLRRICPKNRCWVVDEVDALPARMLALVRLLALPG